MDALPPNVVVDLTRTHGQVLIATFIATAFWGMTCMQTLMYFITYESDRWSLKTLVIGLLALDTAHEVICIQGLWTNLIPKFGDLVNITLVHMPFALEPLFTGIIALLAQAFFAWRFWSFSNKNWLFPIVMLPLIIGPFVGTVVGITREIGTSLSFIESQAHNRKWMLGVHGAVAGTDILIAVIMAIFLLQGRTNFVDSNRMTLRLVNASVSTGACMAIFAFVSIILAIVYPRDLFYVLGSLPLSALYCNTVLANLNSRRTVKGSKADLSMNLRNNSRTIPISTLSTPGFTLSRTVDSTIDADLRGDEDLEAKHAEYDEPAISVQVETSKTTGYH